MGTTESLRVEYIVIMVVLLLVCVLFVCYRVLASRQAAAEGMESPAFTLYRLVCVVPEIDVFRPKSEFPE